MIIDDPWYGWTSGLVTAITMRKSATDPLDVNHLCPLMTHSSPSRTADVVNSVGSDPAVSGSVMEKADCAASPSSSGCSHCARCVVVPAGLDPHRQQLGVARVRRVVAEDHRRQRRLPEDLVHQPQPHLPEPHAAELRRQVRRPQALGLDLLLQRPDEHAHLVVRRDRASRAGTPPRARTRASTPASPRTRARSRNPRPWPLLPALPAELPEARHPATTVGAVTTTSPVVPPFRRRACAAARRRRRLPAPGRPERGGQSGDRRRRARPPRRAPPPDGGRAHRPRRAPRRRRDGAGLPGPPGPAGLVRARGRDRGHPLGQDRRLPRGLPLLLAVLPLRHARQGHAVPRYRRGPRRRPRDRRPRRLGVLHRPRRARARRAHHRSASSSSSPASTTRPGSTSR